MKKLYAVMTINKFVNVNGQTQKTLVGGIDGYIPVFDTLCEAEKQSYNGKFEILEIEVEK